MAPTFTPYPVAQPMLVNLWPQQNHPMIHDEMVMQAQIRYTHQPTSDDREGNPVGFAGSIAWASPSTIHRAEKLENSGLMI